MSYFWSLAFLAVVPLVMAYTSGAPASACVNLTPGHRYYNAGVLSLPQTRPSPYALSVSKNMYTPSEELTVSVTGGSFKGILLQARLADDTLVGTFTDLPQNTKLLQCTNPGDTVTHANCNVKSAGTSFTWTAPGSDVGNVIFTATFVFEYDVFWVKVTSQEIMASTDVIHETICGSDGEDYHYYADILQMLVANARLAPNSFCDTVPLTDDPSVISDRCVPEGTVICNGPRCDMRVTIDYVPDTDSYDVTINTPIGMDEWTGIGFSRNGAMIGSDAILVWMNSDDHMIQVKDYQLDGRYTRAVVEDSNSDGLTFQETHYQDGILNVRFNRLRNTGDSNDFVFTDEDSGCARLLLPKPGGGFGSVRNGVVQYHGRTPMVTSSICIRPCIDGGWSDWTEWGACQARVCRKKSHRFRNRSCSNPEPLYGGSYCEGNSSESEKCKKADCPVDGGWSDWSKLRLCSQTCGEGGYRARYRTCSKPIPQHGGLQCLGGRVNRTTCSPLGPCPVDGGWSDWSRWRPCSQTCGTGGSRARNRTCSNPRPQHGGLQCEGSRVNRTTCSPLGPCPVDGGWSDWTEWGACRARVCKTKGKRFRTRSCSNPEPLYDGSHCEGNSSESEKCKKADCPVHGGWSAWRDSNPCSSTCGYSTRNQIRTCDNPAPARRGRDCIGPSSKTIQCRVPASCPRDDGIHEAGPSWSSLVPQPGQSFSSVGSASILESRVRPVEAIQTTAKAPEESPVPMLEDLARLIEVIQTPVEVENHNGLLGSAGGNGNITYEKVPYTFRKQLIHVDSSGGHTRIHTASRGYP